MDNSRLRIPTNNELRAWLRIRHGELQDTNPAYVGMHQYIRNRPDGWCGHVVLLRYHDLPESSAGWNELVGQLISDYEPETDTIPAVIPPTPSIPNERIPLPDGLHLRDRSWAQGMECTPRRRTVLVWDWRRKEYVPDGYEDVYVVSG